MELFNEIDEFHQLLLKETSAKLDCDLEGFQDLETKYASLHDSYSKEIENSKKVEKCLLKCLKFYSKLSKKYEAQQKIIIALEESVKEKVHSLEESLKTQEELKGVIEVYRTERSVYAGITHESLRKDKEFLLDICCKLISECVATDNIRNIGNLILRRFKKDLDDEKLVKLLRLRHIIKEEVCKKEESEDVTPPKLTDLKLEEEVKLEKSPNTIYSPREEKEEAKTEKKIHISIETCTESQEENSNAKDHNESFISDEDDDMVSVEENKTNISLPLLEGFMTSDNYENVNEKPAEEENRIEVVYDAPKKISMENSCKINSQTCHYSLKLEQAETTECNENKAKILENKSIENEKPQLFCLSKKNDYNLKNCVEKREIENKNLNFENDEKNSGKTEVEKIFQECDNTDENELFELKCEKPTAVSDINTVVNRTSDRVRGDNNKNKKLVEFSSEYGKSNSNFFSNVVTSPKAQNLLTFNKSIFDVPEVKVNRINTLQAFEPPILEFGSPLNEKQTKNQVSNCSTNKSLNGTNIEYNEEDLNRIFREMKNVRLLSPIREVTDVDKSQFKIKSETIIKIKSENSPEFKRKRNSNSSSSVNEPIIKSKKVKSNECQTGFLDSIMTAMSQQNEEFKACKAVIEENKPEVEEKEKVSLTPKKLGLSKTRPRYSTRKYSKENFFTQKSFKGDKDKQSEVMEALKEFISSPMTSKEEADKSVKKCISVLRNKPEQIVAKNIVAVVFENVDESIEIFERPAPPLTKTQHRLIVLLSVFKTVDLNSDNIPHIILNLMWEKLFPDKFFWPDDCVETATRFYTALCRSRNDTKTLWKFCLHAMTEMKQRCCLVVFTALKTWPDVLHDASTLQNNILASTVVNIFLYMPKVEGLRNSNQKKKLMALKHLLMNFYQFKMDDTIETYTQKVFNAFWKDEMGSEKALVLIAKCRDWNWTNKNVIFKLKGKLKEWMEGILGDVEGNKILSVIKQICTIFLSEGENATGQAKEIVSCLATALNSGRLAHDTEKSIIQLLLQMKHIAEARAVIREWKPKEAIDEILRNEIINVSAENILRELKLNKKKDAHERKKNSKLKKSKKKTKGKKRKGKKKQNKKEGEVGCVSAM